jgi:PAS domain S-box-containing protein
MHMTSTMADTMLHTAITAVQQGEEGFRRVLDAFPAAIYVTNAVGVITYYNRACIAFAGRIPRVGRDSWCVTWKLYTEEGRQLPHDQCPMAVAIREKRPIRGVEAVAERPDGTRRNFQPYPTPLLDGEGNLVGAVNMLIDVTDLKLAQSLRAQAVKCRRLAAAISDQQTMDILTSMAAEYEERALNLEGAN